MAEIERTLAIVKPDAMERNLTPEIISRIQQAGLKVAVQKEITMSLKQAADLYFPHRGKKFYDGLINFIRESSVCALVVEGKNAVARLRDLMGPTDPRVAPPGTLRCDLKGEVIVDAEGIIRNVIHGSDSPREAEREIGIFFNPSEVRN